jgi:hypothetical protein
MVHKTSIIPGLSKFIDENVLAHYPATSMKRILMAGAVSLYLKQNSGTVDMLLSNPLFSSLGVVHDNGMIDIDLLRDTLKSEIKKAGFMRWSIPLVGDIDFTTDDVDALYRFITELNTQVATSNVVHTPLAPASSINTSGVY